jgi:hypothetical protein
LKKALDECPGELLKEALMSGGKGEGAVFSLFWNELKGQISPEDCFETLAQKSLFFQGLPHSVTEERLKGGLPIAWDQLLPHQYAQLLEGDLGRLLPSEAARICPLDAALTRLKNSGPDSFDPAALREILDRAGGRVGPLLSQWIEKNDLASLSRLLIDPPSSFSATLQHSLGPTSLLLSKPTALVECIRTALLRAVQRRDPDYSACYARLMEIEQEVGALRRLR